MGDPIGPMLLDVLRVLRRRLGRLVAFEIVLFAVSTVIFGPLLALAFAGLLRFSGSKAVTNADILTFVFSLPGLVACLVAGATLIGVAFAKQTGIMYLTAATGGDRRSTVAALLVTVRSLPDATRVGARMIARYALLAVPFVIALGAVHAAILGGKDINFYLATRPPAFYVAIGLAAVICAGWGAAALILYVRWLHAVPLTLVGDVDGSQVLATSARAAKTDWRRIVLVLSAWAGSSLLAGLLAGGIMFAISSGILRLVDAESASLLGVIAVLWALEVIVPFVMLNIWYDGHCVLKMRLHHEAFPREEAVATRVVDAAEVKAAEHGVSWRIIVGLLVVAVLALASYATHRASRFLETPITTTITAHRGSSRRAPENTLAALEAAIEDGADIAEIDVQELSDGTIVLFHDSDLMRVANDRRRIDAVTYDEIRDVDAGTWFAPEFAAERIPTLQQATDVARGRIRLNVELKFHGREQRFVESVVEILREADFLDHAVITSLDHARLAEVRRHDEALPLGAIVTVIVGNLESIDADFYSLEASLANRSLVQRLQSMGRGVHVWTINEPDRMGRYVDLGVASIITDEPSMLADVIAGRRAMPPGERLLSAYRERRVR